MAKLIDDKLDAIFARQLALMERFHQIEKANGLLPDERIPVDIHSHRGQAVLRDYAWRITEELGEAMNKLKNRPWKQQSYPVDVTGYYEELTDVLHFFVELCILSGLDAQTLHDLYMDKAALNKVRQAQGV